MSPVERSIGLEANAILPWSPLPRWKPTLQRSREGPPGNRDRSHRERIKRLPHARPMLLVEDAPLDHLNTFGVRARARWLARVDRIESLSTAIEGQLTRKS
jgi:hypothetical protein